MSVGKTCHDDFNQLDQSTNNLRVHTGNDKAWSALRHIASNWPLSHQTPILLQGPKGSGKTHLMRAFEQQIRSRDNEVTVSWQSCRAIFDDYFRQQSRLKYVAPSTNRHHIDILLLHSFAAIQDSLGLQDLFVQLIDAMIQKAKLVIIEVRHLPSDNALVAPHPDALYLPSYKSFFQQCSQLRITETQDD